MEDDFEGPFGSIAVAEPEPPLEHLGFTEEEYQTTLKVLRSFEKDPERLTHKTYKDLRGAGIIFTSGITKAYFDGANADEYKANRARKDQRHRAITSLKAKDRKMREKAALRQSRIDARAALILPSSVNFLLEDGKATGKVAEPDLDEEDAAAAEAEFNAIVRAPGSTDYIELTFARKCYVCKFPYTRLHFFYDALCPKCAELNYQKRMQVTDMKGRVCIVTGGRVKIGYQIVLKLLRCGATVIATTRFPNDSARRYAEEEDFDSFKDRLHIYALDLRDLSAVEQFCAHVLASYDRLDVIVNNAAQTVRRPPAYYRHLLEAESKKSEGRSLLIHDAHAADGQKVKSIEGIGSVESISQAMASTGSGDTTATSAALSQLNIIEGDDRNDPNEFPEGLLDVNQQQIDARAKNSWTMRLDEVTTGELVETTAINQLSPFVINSRLKPLLIKSPSADKYVVNVSAMEGKFYRHKSVFHPHTNMAKAGNNMMTRTSGEDYAKDKIYMTSVDTGWITDENPLAKAERRFQTDRWQTPIDEVDAMARVLDPVFRGMVDGEFLFGVFLKDYNVSDW